MSPEPRRGSDRLLPERSTGDARLERVPAGIRIRSAAAVRELLRARGATTQAGFTAEAIPTGVLSRHPILLSDGEAHDAQRRELGRFFSPAAVDGRRAPLIDELADRAAEEATAGGDCDLAEVTLAFSVDVARRIVGLTESPLDALSRRLVGFQRQPPVDIMRPGWGRTRRQWAAAAYHGLVPLVRFHLRDVLPAIRARRRVPRDDVISRLLADGARPADVLVECVTYATAGMITTREFMVLATWHLLADDALRTRYRSAEREERRAILAEIIRLDPIVAHLYRRVREDVEVADGDRTEPLAPGDLADLCIADANLDPESMGADPERLCPARTTARGIDPAGLSFGAGAHRCPGQPLAIAETDALLVRLLARDPEIVVEPTAHWDDVIAGWSLRGMVLRFHR